MRILEFLKRLVPSFTKDDVKERIRMITQTLNEFTLAAYLDAVETLKGKLTSKVGRAYETAFARQVKTHFRGTPLEVTQQILQNVLVLLDALESLVDKNYGKDIVVDGITYRKAEILRLVTLFDFGVTYARQVLLYLLVAEANQTAKALPEGKERPGPELAWLKANQESFFMVLALMATPDRDLLKALEDIPEITVSETDDEIVTNTVGINKLDPLKSGFIPGITPIFTAIGRVVANWQVARYNRAKEEKRALEFRLEQLRLQLQGRSDPKLEKAIEFYEGEVDKLAQKIAKMEEDYL